MGELQDKRKKAGIRKKGKIRFINFMFEETILEEGFLLYV